MAEHIVARILRGRAAEIRKDAEAEMEPPFRSMMKWVADQFVQMADELAALEQRPVFDAGWRDVGPTSGGVKFSPQSHGPDLPEGAHPDSPGARELYECTQADDCRVALHPRGLHTPEGSPRLPGLRIVSPAGVSGLGGGGGNTVHVAGGSGGIGAGGGAGGSSWMPEIRIAPHRIEMAAKAAYQRMSAASALASTPHNESPIPVRWEHMDERDRQSWRLAATAALKAALEPEWKP